MGRKWCEREQMRCKALGACCPVASMVSQWGDLTFSKKKKKSSLPLHGKWMEKQWKQWQTLFLRTSKITADGDCSHEVKRRLLLGKKAMTNLDNIFKKQRRYFANKGLSSQSYGFSSSHVWMWESVYKESWAPNNWCFWIVVLEKTLKSPLD